MIASLAFFSSFAVLADPNPGKDSVESQAGLLKLKSKSIRSIRGIETTEETKYKRWKNLKYSGYVRSFTQYRVMPERYSAPMLTDKQLLFNGVEMYNGTLQGYQEPLLLLRLEGNPTSKTYFKIEYAFDNQLTGFVKDRSTYYTGINKPFNRRASSYRILQFEASTSTKFGDFKLISGGGVLWYRVSPFTFWNYEYRDDLFERYPWEPEGAAWNRYNMAYATQNIARDARWGNTATQGFILEARNLPKGFGANIVYGKTDNSGGFQTYVSRTPRNMAAFRLDKMFGPHKIGLNYFSQFGFTDASGTWRVRQQIVTADGRLNFNKFKVYFEAGGGRFADFIATRDIAINLKTLAPNSIYVADTTKLYHTGDIGGVNWNWRPAIMTQWDFDKSMFGFNLNAMFYYIDKSTVNVNSQVLNSANPHALATPTNIGSVYDVTTYYGVVTDIGQMANNRTGAYLKHEETYGKLKVMLGTGIAMELENLNNGITYQHRANAFTRSRFAFFTNYNGPYGRIRNIFRRTFETITITDTVVNYKKGFNSIDLNLKYKFNVLGRDLIVANYNNFSSVGEGFSPIPKFSDKAFLRYFYEEFMVFYSVHRKVSVVGFTSFENGRGNMRTDLADANGNKTTLEKDPNAKPIDQIGTGYGLGLDYDVSGRAGLYLRNRWFQYHDNNFTADKFKGHETSFELKIFF